MAVFSVTVNRIGPTTTVASRGEFFAGAVPVVGPNGDVFINAFTTPASPFGVFALSADNRVRIIGTNNVETINASLIDPLGEVPPGSTSTPTRRDNLIFGNAGDDTIFGGAGDDLVDGGAGDDSIVGGDGGDDLFGGDGADTIVGGAGTDFISGGDGADSIVGGDGADSIVGGKGADVLTGSIGADRFVFAIGDSPANAPTIDVITDFAVGVDLIDVPFPPASFGGALILFGVNNINALFNDIDINFALGFPGVDFIQVNVLSGAITGSYLIFDSNNDGVFNGTPNAAGVVDDIISLGGLLAAPLPVASFV